jgi:ribosomal protein S18 acetylase RimI-like enzyme
VDPATDAIAIVAATADDLATVARLADVIWRRHYPGIITHEQIDYMLARGYAAPALRLFLDTPGAGLAIATVGGEPAGFAAWCRVGEPATAKLDKLYVLQDHHRRGIGRRLIAHVEAAARADGATTLVLNVNKRNTTAIDAYRRCGFAVRESVAIDIGDGFVMDDYIMAKPLAAASAPDLR